MSRKLIYVVLVVIAIWGGLWLREHFAPENVVKRAFLDAVEAFEDERFLATMTVIDRGYRDEFGQSYESLAGHIRVLQETYEKLELSLEAPAVEVQDGRARMRIHFVLRGSYEGQRGYILGSLGAPCSADLEWNKQPQGWRIISTTELRIPELQDELDRVRQRD